ncbi:MAG: hypothetical protein IIW33_03470, partial [Oscillospiraceae bacterium]|nr:hypothetical protein [Oscillospiraceae bacterium]
MKKILSIMLAALLVFALCACQGGTDAGKDSSLETPTSSKLALTSKPSSQVEESSSKLDKELEAVGGGPELLKFAEAFAEIPVGYLGTLDDDYSAFKDRADFKETISYADGNFNISNGNTFKAGTLLEPYGIKVSTAVDLVPSAL